MPHLRAHEFSFAPQPVVRVPRPQNSNCSQSIIFTSFVIRGERRIRCGSVVCEVLILTRFIIITWFNDTTSRASLLLWKKLCFGSAGISPPNPYLRSPSMESIPAFIPDYEIINRNDKKNSQAKLPRFFQSFHSFFNAFLNSSREWLIRLLTTRPSQYETKYGSGKLLLNI